MRKPLVALLSVFQLWYVHSRYISSLPPELAIVTFAYIAPDSQASSGGYSKRKPLRNLLCRFLTSVIVNRGNVTLFGYDDFQLPESCKHCTVNRRRRCWTYNVMTAGHGKMLEKYASSLPPYTIIAVTDVFDVVFSDDVTEIATRLQNILQQRPGTIFWAFARGCYPAPGWQENKCNIHSHSYGINAGFYAGFAKDIVLLSKKFQQEDRKIRRKKLPPTGGDQGIWIRLGERSLQPLSYRRDTQQDFVRFPVTLDGKRLTIQEFVSKNFSQPIAHCSGPAKYPCVVLYDTLYGNLTTQEMSVLKSATVLTHSGKIATPLTTICPPTEFHPEVSLE